MADHSDLDATVVVSAGGVTVEKSFAADEFPVPAVKFVIRSTVTEPTDVRLIDDVPESFPMEGIGFHPQYDSENWTAYRDNRVEYERALAPGEEVLTVYGVRVDDAEEVAAFLTEPTLEYDTEAPESAGETPDEILGRETTRPVRDALAGDRTLSGSAGATSLEPSADVDAKSDAAPTPRTLDDDATAAITERSDDEADVPDGDAVAEAIGGTADSATGEETLGTNEGILGRDEDADDPDPDSEVDAFDLDRGLDPVESESTGSVAAALAAELREGRVDDADVELLRSELDVGVPNSVEVRIERLQARMDDLAAYSEALEAFLDEEGTGQQLIESFRADVAAVESELDELDATVETLDADQVALREEVDFVDSSVDEAASRLDDAEAELASLDDRIEEVGATAEAVREESSAEVAGVREDVESVRSDVDEVCEEIEELQSFRNRLTDVLGD